MSLHGLSITPEIGSRDFHTPPYLVCNSFTFETNPGSVHWAPDYFPPCLRLDHVPF